jgi:hypothetical protein
MPIPASIAERVETFRRNLESYVAADYKETELRREFLDPLFAALGWDVFNLQGYAEAYKDVVHEDMLKINGQSTAPDYSFRIGGNRKFFVEAKKPAVRIKDDPIPAAQLRRYSWTAKLPLGIVTDFQEFAIYDTRIRPRADDKASTGRIFYCTYEEFAQKWDEIAAIFSKDSVLKGSFDKYAATNRGKRGTSEFDDDFLADLENWRQVLAVNLAKRNTLDERELNFAVQRILDRIVFLRIAEDRGIEPLGQLQALTAGPRIYPRLREIFERADLRYNSGLFHFENEKGREESPDRLTLGLDIDDAVLKDVLSALYWPRSPYAFSVVSADILGHVYEQFLGKVIQLDGPHKVKVEKKPEVRKAGGVYYTPTYIVDYIVRQTVGPLVDGKTPKQIEKIRVLDPACGSGSFLLGAYDFLLAWYLDYYAKNDPAGWAKKKQPPIYETSPNAHGVGKGNGGWRLTTNERKRILVTHIYGVDIDTQAVEVTKLSLLLKVLEGEARELQGKQMDFHRVLPDLGNNIKCGNSLIGSDFYAQADLPELDDEARYKLNVFDWAEEFKPVMSAGGFDAVIGNPPWGAELSDESLAYLRVHHRRVIGRMVDSYIYFIDKATYVTRSGAPIGFVVPSTVLNQSDTRPIRDVLLERGLTHLISLGQGVFGKKVLNTSTIFVTSTHLDKHLQVLDVSSSRTNTEKALAIKVCRKIGWKSWHLLVERDSQHTFFTGSFEAAALYMRLLEKCPSLESMLVGGIQRGVSPDVAEAHVVTDEEIKALKLEIDVLRRSVSGPRIKRYNPCRADQWIIYTTRDTPIAKYPNVLRHLDRFRSRNTCREVKDGKHPYWALHRPRDPEIFASPKLIGLTTSKRIELIYDEQESLYVTDAMYVLTPKDGLSLALSGVMQSRLFFFLYRVSNEGESRVIPQIKAVKLGPLPVPVKLKGGKQVPPLIKLVERMLKLHADVAAAKSPDVQTRLQREIKATDTAIDQLVYQLYELTPEEIALVEAATAPVVKAVEAEGGAVVVPSAAYAQAEMDAAHHYTLDEDSHAKS